MHNIQNPANALRLDALNVTRWSFRAGSCSTVAKAAHPRYGAVALKITTGFCTILSQVESDCLSIVGAERRAALRRAPRNSRPSVTVSTSAQAAEPLVPAPAALPEGRRRRRARAALRQGQRASPRRETRGSLERQLRGREGRPGPQGPEGEMGVLGPVGMKGVTGPAGPRGFHGSAGNIGKEGEVGIKGLQGDQGQKGFRGQVGAAGEYGKMGDRGLPGEHGMTGDRGAQVSNVN